MPELMEKVEELITDNQGVSTYCLFFLINTDHKQLTDYPLCVCVCRLVL